MSDSFNTPKRVVQHTALVIQVRYGIDLTGYTFDFTVIDEAGNKIVKSDDAGETVGVVTAAEGLAHAVLTPEETGGLEEGLGQYWLAATPPGSWRRHALKGPLTIERGVEAPGG